jgi:hypothetical protein
MTAWRLLRECRSQKRRLAHTQRIELAAGARCANVRELGHKNGERGPRGITDELARKADVVSSMAKIFARMKDVTGGAPIHLD